MAEKSNHNILAEGGKTTVPNEQYFQLPSKMEMENLSKEDLVASLVKKAASYIERQKSQSVEDIVSQIDTRMQKRLADFKTEFKSELISMIDGQIKAATEPIKNRLGDLETENERRKGEIYHLNRRYTELQEEVTQSAHTVDENVSSVRSSLDIKLGEAEQKIADLQTQLEEATRVTKDPLEDVNLTVIAQNYAETLFTPLTDAENLVAALNLDTEVKVIKATRLENRSQRNRPALLKFSMESLDQKIAVLRAKKSLKNAHRQDLKDVWIRSSMTKEQRTQRHNCTQLLKELDAEKDYRFLGSGRLVRNKRGGERVVHRTAHAADSESDS